MLLPGAHLLPCTNTRLASNTCCDTPCRFKLNIATGQYVEAAKDALNLAAFEQSEGNYRVAHDKLFGTVKKLEELGVGAGSCGKLQKLSMYSSCILHACRDVLFK